MLSVREVAQFTGGDLVDASLPSDDAGGGLVIDAVTTDSRAVPARSLFVALSGERFDGHAFIDQVAMQGASAVLVERPHRSQRLVSIVVDDTRRALGDLAAGWRRRFDLPLIAVTGSNGKTTTKEMIASVLAAAYGEDDRCATRGNLNNEIGVPLTLLRLRTHHRAAVIELGMNHPGETARLAEIVRPVVALVVNAQREHQEFMVSIAAVADEHALAIAALPAEGVAVYPADDPHADVWKRSAAHRRVVDFACSVDDEVDIGFDAAVVGRARLDDDAIALRLDARGATVHVRLSAPGLHNARNATAAAAACLAAGIALETIRVGLEAFRPVRGRSQRRLLGGGTVVIDDSYNANPDSMRAAIDLLATQAAPRLMVMGDMGEVGEGGARFHAEVGAHAHARGIESLYALGDATRASVQAFGSAGRHFDAVEPLIAAVEGWVAALPADIASRGAIVVKGSRFMRMERVVAALHGDVAEGAH